MFELLLGNFESNSWIACNMVPKSKLGIQKSHLAKDSFRETMKDSLHPRPYRKNQHTFIKPEGPGRKKRRPCIRCYRTLRLTMPSREADKKVRRIISYCNDCPNKPGYCLQCFYQTHN